jgi:hypothetical protein
MASAIALGRALSSIFERMVGESDVVAVETPPPEPEPEPEPEPFIPAYLTDKFLQQAVWICPVCGCYNSSTVSRCRECGHKKS